jgi:formylglycine-generating enzyme required for sulfatase activity
VSWHDAKQFVSLLSAKTGKTYRLPSEAEWEYACRAGGRHEYCGSDSADNVSWYSGKATNPVAGKQANAWGLHDMSGNVWEWTEDCWNGNYSSAPTDGSAWTAGDCSLKVVRGGSWFDDPQVLRSANRGRFATAVRLIVNGFRVARTD